MHAFSAHQHCGWVFIIADIFTNCFVVIIMQFCGLKDAIYLYLDSLIVGHNLFGEISILNKKLHKEWQHCKTNNVLH